MKEYRIYPYIQNDLEDFQVLQNYNSLTIIKDKRIAKFLDDIRKKDGNEDNIFNINQLNNTFGDETQYILEFLINNRIIEELKIIDRAYQKISMISNNKTFLECTSFAIEEDNINCIYNTELDLINYNNIKDDFVIIYLNPFNYKSFLKIDSILKENNIISRFIIYYNHKHYITNIYRKEWNNPCPVCFISQLETTLRANSILNDVPSFQTIVDLIYTKSTMFPFSKEINRLEAFSILYNVWLDMDDNDDLKYKMVSSYDYNNKSIQKDVAIHWELCDCYEK